MFLFPQNKAILTSAMDRECCALNLQQEFKLGQSLQRRTAINQEDWTVISQSCFCHIRIIYFFLFLRHRAAPYEVIRYSNTVIFRSGQPWEDGRPRQIRETKKQRRPCAAHLI